MHERLTLRGVAVGVLVVRPTEQFSSLVFLRCPGNDVVGIGIPGPDVGGPPPSPAGIDDQRLWEAARGLYHCPLLALGGGQARLGTKCPAAGPPDLVHRWIHHQLENE